MLLSSGNGELHPEISEHNSFFLGKTLTRCTVITGNSVSVLTHSGLFLMLVQISFSNRNQFCSLEVIQLNILIKQINCH